MEQRPASLRWSRYSPPSRCAATEPRSRPSSDVCEAERHGSSCGEEHADMVCGEGPRWCCATKGLVSRGTAKGMACGAEPFTCCSRVLHMLHFIGFNLFSVLVIYQWIDGTLAGGTQDALQLRIRRPWHLHLTSTYRVEALCTLRAMDCTRARVLFALSARFSRGGLCTVWEPRRSQPSEPENG